MTRSILYSAAETAPIRQDEEDFVAELCAGLATAAARLAAVTPIDDAVSFSRSAHGVDKRERDQ